MTREKTKASELDAILEQIENLSLDQLFTVQEQLTRQMRLKTSTAANGNGTHNQPSPRVVIPGAYTPTIEEVEASLARIFTPEELAKIGKTDFKKISLGSKSLSEMVNEDREDRF